jgi:hypothetical protein
MRKTMFRIALGLALMAPSFAQALPITSVTYQAASIGSLTDESGLTDFEPMAWAFREFDPNLGTLLSMTFNFTADISTILKVSNAEGAGSSVGDVSTVFQVSVSGGNLTGQPQINATCCNFEFSLADGESTESDPVAASFASAPLSYSFGAIMGQFTGAGGITFETLTVSTLTLTELAATGGNISDDQDTLALLNGSVTYVYDALQAPPPPNLAEVPEPSSMLLLGGGLLALGYHVRRKRS